MKLAAQNDLQAGSTQMDLEPISPQVKQGNAKRDVAALGISVAAIIMFVGTGSAVLPQIFRNWIGIGSGPDVMLVNALLLNIALIIFGWRRYREIMSELEQHRTAEEDARLLADTDVLTGCLNRRSITPETDRLIDRANLEGKHTAFIMLDLDNFKQVNDCNGHQVGDIVLKKTAERMKEISPSDSLLARLGGDEFACVISFAPEYRDRVDHLVARFIEVVSQPIPIGEQEVRITISAGIATTAGKADPDSVGLDASNLLHLSDIAMYHAKKQGRNRYFWFEGKMEHELRLRNELEAGIRKGVTNGEFVPYYEQQIDLHSGELAGFEMLARWLSPELGFVKPDIFIPVAEEMGIIGALSDQLIDQALSDAAHWDPNLTLSVNISPIQLRDPWFSQKILKSLVKHNFPPQRLEIEISETCLHENLGLVRSTITSLRNQGVSISLDDFGTGYSSLSQLQSLPFDRLKIDRSFVGDLARNNSESGLKIINAIIALGYDLSIPITAEGIEGLEMLDRLKVMGPLKGQGYHYGQPETAARVKDRLSKLGRYSPRPDHAGIISDDEAAHTKQPPLTARKTG
jgi:diguanylate cyclase (GGDEF)-like protein